MRVMGVDPGIEGAIAVVERGRVIKHARMPVKPGPAGRKKVDGQILLDIMRSMAEDGLDKAIVENPSAMPKQGVSSSFAFGRSCGIAEMAVIALGVPYDLISPSHWKRVMRVPADKGASRARATELMPKDRSLWARPAGECFAEAAMIGLWGLGELSADVIEAGQGVIGLFDDVEVA